MHPDDAHASCFPAIVNSYQGIRRSHMEFRLSKSRSSRVFTGISNDEKRKECADHGTQVSLVG